jgi:hypothetical protein
MAAKRGLLAEIQATQKPKQSRYCGVGLAYDALGDEADQLTTALEDRMITAKVISEVLAGRGINVHRDVIVRHRRGDCKCEPR